MPDQTSQATSENSDRLMEHTATIVAAYVSNNSTRLADLPKLIATVIESLSATPTLKEKVEAPGHIKPAVRIAKSVTKDHIVCLDCGKRFRSLKHHIFYQHDLTPEQYRGKWGLSHDYSMHAASLGAARAHYAKTQGLGKIAVERYEAKRSVLNGND